VGPDGRAIPVNPARDQFLWVQRNCHVVSLADQRSGAACASSRHCHCSGRLAGSDNRRHGESRPGGCHRWCCLRRRQSQAGYQHGCPRAGCGVHHNNRCCWANDPCLSVCERYRERSSGRISLGELGFEVVDFGQADEVGEVIEWHELVQERCRCACFFELRQCILHGCSRREQRENWHQDHGVAE